VHTAFTWLSCVIRRMALWQPLATTRLNFLLFELRFETIRSHIDSIGLPSGRPWTIRWRQNGNTIQLWWDFLFLLRKSSEAFAPVSIPWIRCQLNISVCLGFAMQEGYPKWCGPQQLAAHILTFKEPKMPRADDNAGQIGCAASASMGRDRVKHSKGLSSSPAYCSPIVFSAVVVHRQNHLQGYDCFCHLVVVVVYYV